jgi:hypothetical protein
MPSARLQKVERYLAQHPKVSTRESAKDRAFQQYLEGLSVEELTALYEKSLEEYRNSPEGIALDKRLEGMSIEELMREMNEMLKAS